MAKFSKNEVLILNRDVNVAGESYKKDSLFVVTKVNPKSIEVSLLDDKNNITSQGISGPTSVIESAFTSKNINLVIPKAETAKKGEFYIFKKELKEDSICFPVGTRVVITKGGAKPTFETLYKQENKNVDYVSGLTVYAEFITEYLQISEAKPCDLTADFQMKGLEKRTGEETPNFKFSLYYKNKKIGEASNNGEGGGHRVHIYDNAWKELLAKGFEIAKAVTTVNDEQFAVKKYDIEEATVDFFLENHNGLTTYKEYIECFVREYCNLVESLE